MKKIIAAFGLLIGLFVVVSIVWGVTASYNQTIRIVNSAGTVIDGVASATTGLYSETVRVVDSAGNVIDNFASGAGGTITNANINGEQNVKSPGYAASGLDTTFTGTVAAGASALTLTTNYDGPVNSYIKIPGAGTDQAFAQPSAPTVDPGTEFREVRTITAGTVTTSQTPVIDVGVTDYNSGWPYQVNCPTPGAKQYCFAAGAFAFNSADNTSVVVIDYIQTTVQGGSAHTYQLAAADDNGGYSQASAATSVTIGTQAVPALDLSNAPGNGTLASANGTAVVLPALPTGATKWLIYKDGALVGLSRLIWLKGTPATAPAIAATWVDNAISFNGQATQGAETDYPTTAPAAASPDRLITKVTAYNGTALTISPVATSAVTSQAGIRHDDTNAFQAACDAVMITGGTASGTIMVPSGTYRITSTVTCAPVTGTEQGFVLRGQSPYVNIAWDGAEESDAIVVQNSGREEIANLRFVGGPARADLALSQTTGGVTLAKISKINCNNNFHHCILGGLDANGGSVSEVNVDQSGVTGSNRNWAAFEVQGANNLDWVFNNTGCGTGLYPYPTCFSNANTLSLHGGMATNSAMTTFIQPVVAGNPQTGFGIPCTNCGMWAVGAGGTYTWVGGEIETSGMFFNLNFGTASINVDLVGIHWNTATQANQARIVRINDANMFVNSVGNNWNTPLTFDIAAGAFSSVNDLFLTSGHSTVAAYFTQALATSPAIQVIQKGVYQGPVNTGTHLINSVGAKPTVTLNNCGTITAGSVTSGTDVSGSETTGTSTTSCVVHFANTWAVAPQCFCKDITVPGNIAGGACTANTTDLTIPMTSNTNDVVQWFCMSN